MRYDWEDDNKEVPFGDLVGKVILKIIGLTPYDKVVKFQTATEQFSMFHQQDCCEHVAVEEVIGDVSDLIGSEVVSAVVTVEGCTDLRTEDGEYSVGKQNYTFYTIQTKKGCVTIRWRGESNGYYSHEVSFEKADFEPGLKSD